MAQRITTCFSLKLPTSQKQETNSSDFLYGNSWHQTFASESAAVYENGPQQLKNYPIMKTEFFFFPLELKAKF